MDCTSNWRSNMIMVRFVTCTLFCGHAEVLGYNFWLLLCWVLLNFFLKASTSNFSGTRILSMLHCPHLPWSCSFLSKFLGHWMRLINILTIKCFKINSFEMHQDISVKWSSSPNDSEIVKLQCSSTLCTWYLFNTLIQLE